MQILITAGGVREQIDRVRAITNTSTGRLGALIAEAFSACASVAKIHYLCGAAAVLPQSGKTEIIRVTDAASLEAAVRSVLEQNRIDAVVHCMAVSDYRVRQVTSAAMMASACMALLEEGPAPANLAEAEAFMLALLDKSAPVADSRGKISSHIRRMALIMEQTPKIISLFQNLSPQSVLVGFKLLDHASHEALMDAAYELLEKNKCDFVLANDLRDITEDGHIGYLVSAGKTRPRLNTKEEIAEAVVRAVLEQKKSQGDSQ
jgi:phosphopantothenate-cysteine ligase